MFCKNKYTILSFILFIILVVPFYLRYRDSRFEVYPAILLPSGASTIKRNGDTLILKKLEIKTPEGKYLPSQNVFGEIKEWHIPYLRESDFGMNSVNERQTLIYNPVHIELERSNRFKPCDSNKVIEYFRNNLKLSGIDIDYIVLETWEIYLNSKDFKLLNKEEVSSEKINLDE